MGLENPLHIVFLLALLLIVFGAKRLPEMGRQLGTGMREFKDGITGIAKAPAISEQNAPAGAQQASEGNAAGPAV